MKETRTADGGKEEENFGFLNTGQLFCSTQRLLTGFVDTKRVLLNPPVNNEEKLP